MEWADPSPFTKSTLAFQGGWFNVSDLFVALLPGSINPYLVTTRKYLVLGLTGSSGSSHDYFSSSLSRVDIFIIEAG